jgi:hypothetical protein
MQTLQNAAVQAFRCRACRFGFLFGFAAGCLGVIASLDPVDDRLAHRRPDDAPVVEHGRADRFDALPR